ncbi:MAG: FGGY family carbohydrate kinase [Micromonosporaceae bacterium]
MYLGIDIGTSVTKAAVFDQAGQLQAVESRRTRLDSPAEGWFEQDPDDVLDSVAAVARAAVAKTGQVPSVVGLTGQGDGVWLVDADGRPVRPAISWMDGRAVAILRQWLARGVVEKVFRQTGNTMFPGSAGPILAWLAEHEPDSLARASTAGYCKDVVMQRLTGVRATDASDASLPFLDPGTGTYHTEALGWCGLSQWSHLLAPVTTPAPVGELTTQAAELLGVPAGTPVTSGPFDLPASALGSGVDTPGEGHIIVGTTLACQVYVDAADTGGEAAGMTLAAYPAGTGEAAQRAWLRAMPAMVGTAAIDWVLDLIGQPHTALEDLLAASPAGAHGVTCLPYFSPAGERAPFLEPRARAQFDRLTVQTTKPDLVRASCEAVAYAARHCFEAAGLDGEVAMCGGGTRSGAWLQMFADALGRPVRLAPQPETGARGAVIAALRTLGHPVDMAAWTAPHGVVEPGPDATYYADGYAGYRARVDAARETWKGIE